MAPAYHAVGSALRAVAGRGARGRGGRGSGHVGCRRPRAGCALPDIRRRPPVAPGPLAALPGHVHGRGARVAVGGSPACERAAGRLTAKSAARRPAISHTPDPLRFPSRAVHGPHACEGYPMTLPAPRRSEEHTSELQSPCNLVCRLLLEKKKKSPRRSPHKSLHLSTHFDLSH